MRRPIIECVANFSEGRNPSVVEAIAGSILREPGVALLDQTIDPDHHRSVLTFAGPPENVSAAAVQAVAMAAQLIDLTSHAGVHPRLGAADVVPFVPLQGITLEQCAELARHTGEEIWKKCGVPVYFYEAAALHPERRRLEDVRRGGFEALREAVRSDPSRRPDIGGPELHPTAGAVIIGARKVLVAWNVNLASNNLSAAKSIARTIRESSGGFAHLKALGLLLASRGQAQISMNLTDYERTPMHVVFSEIRRLAALQGEEIAGTEIIGLIPQSALECAGAAAMRLENFEPGIVLERRVAKAFPSDLDDLLGRLSDPGCHRSGARAAAVSGAASAALGLRVSRMLGRDGRRFEEHRQFFAAATEASGSSADAAEAARAALLVTEHAALLEGDLAELGPDGQAALALAEAARKAGVAEAALHVARIESDAVRNALEKRLRALP